MVLVSPSFKVATDPDMPRYVPLTGWKRLASLIGFRFKRDIAVLFVPAQNTYVVAPASLEEFIAKVNALGFYQGPAEPGLRVIK